jgi:hypothetical protein
MPHNASKVLLGVTRSSDKAVTEYNSDPATYEAGLAVRQASTAGTLGLAKASGKLVGVSLGKSLSDHKKTAVCRAGLQVPIQLTDDEDDYAYVVPGALVWIDDVSGKANAEDDEDIATTVSQAVYVSGPIDGVNEAGENVKVAIIDMPGGL